jgi:hypothetical protein
MGLWCPPECSWRDITYQGGSRGFQGLRLDARFTKWLDCSLLALMTQVLTTASDNAIVSSCACPLMVQDSLCGCLIQQLFEQCQ